MSVILSSTESKPRIQSIDLLRGVVMIIMALDHCRDFLHVDSFIGNDPLDFNTTTPALFLTRWITHFCAPIFVFLAGTSIYFMGQRRTKKSLAGFLITRGLWLILLEMTLINWGWVGNMSYRFLGVFVIWALGWCMIFMAGFIYLPKRLLLILGLLLVAGHNALDFLNTAVDDTFGGFIWSVLHVPHAFMMDADHVLFIGYPLIPWVGLMILGFMLGSLYHTEFSQKRRQTLLLTGGAVCIGLFMVLRFGNIYGDSHVWAGQATPVFTVLSFIDTTKYPPSLLYALMTIGPGLLFLAFAETWKNKVVAVVIVFGRVPFFYYILHVYLIHLVAFGVFFVTGYSWNDLDPNNVFGGFPKGYGVDLWLVYVLWAAIIAMLYFPCRWYNRYKSTHNAPWLSYL